MTEEQRSDLGRFRANNEPDIQLGIVSDGTPFGFDVVDTVSGRRLGGLMAVKVFADFEHQTHCISAEVKFMVYDEKSIPGIRLTPEQVKALQSGKSNVEVVEDGKQ